MHKQCAKIKTKDDYTKLYNCINTHSFCDDSFIYDQLKCVICSSTIDPYLFQQVYNQTLSDFLNRYFYFKPDGEFQNNSKYNKIKKCK